MSPAMSALSDILRSHPANLRVVDRDALITCIEECVACAQACVVCSDACLSESDDELPTLRGCIRATGTCADICAATARTLTRHHGVDPGLIQSILRACAAGCRSCAAECEQHSNWHEHCAECATACRSCEQLCLELSEKLEATR